VLLRMFDSVTAADIPPDVDAVAGYVDGHWRWSTSDWDRFVTKRRIRIATLATTLDADALDVEFGDATPDQAPGWVRHCRPAPGRLPLVYCNRTLRPLVERACAGLRYLLWIATLDGHQVTQPGATATQWAGQTSGSGGHFDLSLIDAAYFGVVAAEELVMGGSPIQAFPLDPTRTDVVVVGRDGHVYRSFGQGAGELDHEADWYPVDPEHTPAGGWVSCGWAWSKHNESGPDAWRQNIIADDGQGSIYAAVIDWAGEQIQGWTRVPFDVRIAPAPPVANLRAQVGEALRAAADELTAA
jgi:hypothetical protein